MTCKDCCHYEVCGYRKEKEPTFYGDAKKYCKYFKDKSTILELPCKTGKKVFQTDGIRVYESVIKNVIFETDGIAFDKRAIGKSVFLTREEAEKALEEMNDGKT